MNSSIVSLVLRKIQLKLVEFSNFLMIQSINPKRLLDPFEDIHEGERPDFPRVALVLAL